jgi:predicted SnoaL-like aldol condensation-catalyzing enzyme
MNKERQRKAIARKFMKKPVTKFSEIVLENQPFIPKGMTKAYSNNRYVVMIYENSLTTSGSATRCMIQKIDNTPILNHWSEIQKIKNEIFGEEVTAVEYYPAQSKLVDDYNIYWIWIFDSGVLPIPIV